MCQARGRDGSVRLPHVDINLPIKDWTPVATPMGHSPRRFESSRLSMRRGGFDSSLHHHASPLAPLSP